MKLFSLSHLGLFLLCWNIPFSSVSQNFKFLDEEKTQIVNFEFVNNLIVIPVEVNGVEFKFILDSGVSVPIMFNIITSDSLKIHNTEKVKIRGLGNGEPIEGIKSIGNSIRFNDILGMNQEILIVANKSLNISTDIGFIVNGVIGYSILKDFIVEINYESQKISLTSPEEYDYKNCKNCESFDLFFYKNKPFLTVEVESDELNDKVKTVQLLIDSGSTESIWLFENGTKEICAPTNSFKDFIGEGMSGEIYGMRNKLVKLSLKSFVLEGSNVAYLDSISTHYARKMKSRNGSLGSNILKRFNIIFDYPNSKITFKKNKFFKESFAYNRSGLRLVYSGKIAAQERKPIGFKFFGSSLSDQTILMDYQEEFILKPVFKIAHVRSGSTAEVAGLRENDQVLEINGKSAFESDLGTLVNEFYSPKKNKRIYITVYRYGRKLKFDFKLEDLL